MYGDHFPLKDFININIRDTARFDTCTPMLKISQPSEI